MDSVGNWYKARAIDKKSTGALLIIVITMALLTAAFYIVRVYERRTNMQEIVSDAASD